MSPLTEETEDSGTIKTIAINGDLFCKMQKDCNRTTHKLYTLVFFIKEPFCITTKVRH